MYFLTLKPPIILLKRRFQLQAKSPDSGIATKTRAAIHQDEKIKRQRIRYKGRNMKARAKDITKRIEL